MGGTKKKSAAQMEKSQDTDKTKKDSQGKKDKKGEKTERRAEIAQPVVEGVGVKFVDGVGVFHGHRNTGG